MSRGIRSRQSVKRAAGTLAAVAILAAFAPGCALIGGADSPEAAASGGPVLKTVRVEQASIRRIEEPIQVTADVVSSVQVDVTASIGGTVEQLYKRIGDSIKAGEPIAKISSEQAEFVYEQAQAAVEQAEASIRNAARSRSAERQLAQAEIRKMESTLKSLERLHNKARNDYDAGLITRAELDTAADELAAFRADLQLVKRGLGQEDGAEAAATLQARLAEAELARKHAENALTQLEIKAPVDGVITGLRLIEGLPVDSMEPVGRIDRIDPVRIVAYLNEEGARLARGKTALRYALPNPDLSESPLELREASVNYLAAIADPDRKTYTLELEVPNAEGALKPGMKALVELSDESTLDALAIPQYAVLEENGRRYAFVLVNGQAMKRELTVGRSSSSYYEVAAGVREGDLIIITGVSGLQDGEAVQLEAAAVNGGVE